MALRLSYRGGASVPLEVEGITPDAVASMSIAEIEKLTVHEGNRARTLGDFFSVSGDPSDQQMEWDGDLIGVHWIGAKMKSGSIRIAGAAGRHIGSEMRGGQILVEGDAGDWVGGEMHGGMIHVRGNAGHLIGAAYRGSAKGMTRGVILIQGNAGNEVGHTLRRGLIAVGGDVGDLVGFNMLAGTILLFGRSGIRHGAGMRRGTIGFLGTQHPQLLPSFRHACRFQPLAIRLLLKQIASYGFPIPDELNDLDVDLYNGDMIEGGRGEMLLRAA